VQDNFIAVTRAAAIGAGLTDRVAVDAQPLLLASVAGLRVQEVTA
jgi:hypothetical protein